MIPYPIEKTWDSIYIIEIEDLIAGGINGADNKPNINLGNRTGFLKKYHGELLIGSTVPSGNMGFNLNSDSLISAFYYNTTNGSFYKLTSISPITWESIQKNVILNIGGLKLNEAGDTTTYTQLTRVNSTLLSLLNKDSQSVNLKVNELKCDTLISNNFTQIQIGNDELRINSGVKYQSQNSDAWYAVNNFTVTEEQNKKYIRWNELLQTWQFISEGTQTGNNQLLSMYTDGLYVNGVEVEIEYDAVIANQSEFDAVFGNLYIPEKIIDENATGGVPKTIFIKSGNYTLGNNIHIIGSNFKIISQGNVNISLADKGIGFLRIHSPFPAVPGETFVVGLTMRDFPYVFKIEGNNNEIFLTIDGTDMIGMDNLFTIDGENNNISIGIKNTVFNDSIVTTDNPTGIISSKNIININEENVVSPYSISNLQNAMMFGNYESRTQTGGKTFNNVTDSILVGLKDGINNISIGNFDE